MTYFPLHQTTCFFIPLVAPCKPLLARNDDTMDSDIDIAIIMKNEMDNFTKERFIRWSAELDIRYDRVFSIVDIQEEKMEKWGNILPFYQNVKKEGIILWKAA